MSDGIVFEVASGQEQLFDLLIECNLMERRRWGDGQEGRRGVVN